MSTTSVSIELRGLDYAFDGAPLVAGAIVVQGSNARIRRVEGSGVVMGPAGGEATVSFDLVSLPIGYHERTAGTIQVVDPASAIDVTVEVELSEARGRPIGGICYQEGERKGEPVVERQLVGVGPAPGTNAAEGTHRGIDAEGRSFLLVWRVDDGGALPDMATLRDVRRITRPGFGSDGNVMAWAMATFRDALYVGTCNWRFDQFRDWEKWAFSRGPIDTSEGAEVWRLSLPTGREEQGTWTRVVGAGLGDSYNHGIRNLTVAGDHLYGITANHTNGFEIWRTADGRAWEAVMTGGFGSTENTSGRGLVVFDGHLYVGTENKDTGAELWRAPVEHAGDVSRWERVLGDDVTRSWYAELTPFKDHLYAASLMTFTGVAENAELGDTHPGCFVMRSRDGVEWEVVVDDAFGTRDNQGIISCGVFRDRIYFGTTNNVGGAEIHASEDGVRWERCLKLVGSMEGPERDWHAWKMYEFGGRLYCGLGRLDEIWWSGLGMYSSADGKEWTRETDNRLLAHYGLRSMAEYRDRLFLGTASFPDCAYVMEARRAG